MTSDKVPNENHSLTLLPRPSQPSLSSVPLKSSLKLQQFIVNSNRAMQHNCRPDHVKELVLEQELANGIHGHASTEDAPASAIQPSPLLDAIAVPLGRPGS